MKIVAHQNSLELHARKNIDELGLGMFLLSFGMVCLYAAPNVLNQEWSYRFGAVPPWERVCLCIFAILLGLFSLTGGVYNAFKKSYYKFDLQGKVFIAGEYIISTKGLKQFHKEELSGIIISSKKISPDKERFWVGVALSSGEKIFFAEYFDDKATADKIVSAIQAIAALDVINE